jgi:hypothetical protein
MSFRFLRPLLLSVLPSGLACAQQGKPGELLTARFGANGTWNLYQPSKAPLSWIKAQEQAAATPDPAGGTGKAGHLATIGSAGENQFVFSYVRGTAVWIGLTDNEKFAGAAEAGGAQHRGWAWVTGEPGVFTHWQTAEPSDPGGAAGKSGEDGVAIENGGRWSDRPMGAPDQSELRLPFMIEWDVQSSEPVPGARVIGAVLPPRWPALDPLPPDADGKAGPWVCVQTPVMSGEPRMELMVKYFTDQWKEMVAFRLPEARFAMQMDDPAYAFGWQFPKAPPFAGNAGNNFGVLARARIQVPEAGIYTFSVHADDGFALRVGQAAWKESHGGGAIDPVDATVFYGMLPSPDSDSRGVIELPAGELPVEVFYFNGVVEGQLQILTAPGSWPEAGGTDRWRLLGHEPSPEKVIWPGVSADGWKVTIPEPGKEGTLTADAKVIDVMARVDDAAAPVTPGLEMIHFMDPDGFRPGRFPGAAPYPGDPAGAQDDRVVLAEATLVIPADGVWHIGVSGDDTVALQIEGGKWERLLRDASGRGARLDGDSLYARRTTNASSQQCIAEIKLARGNYPIRAVSWDRNGTSGFSVFAAPAGYPARLLKKNGAGEDADIPGLKVLPFQQ